MNYYKIEEFYVESISDENLTSVHDIDNEGYNKIIKVTPHFNAMNDLLTNIVQIGSEAELIVQCQSGELNYYISSESDFSFLPTNCKLTLIKFPEEKLKELRNKNVSIGDSFKYDHKVTLRGGIPLECVENRRNTCLDTIISSFHRENFTISIKLFSPTYNEVKSRKDILSNGITVAKKDTKKTENEVPDIFKGLWKNIVGGTTSSYEDYKIKRKTYCSILEREYYSLQRVCIKRSQIEISSSHQDVCNGIADYLKHISNSSSEIECSLRFVQKEMNAEQEYAPFIPISYISSILAFPTTPTPGIKRKKFVNFSADVNCKRESDILLGNYKQKVTTNLPVPFNINALTKHAFVTGVTGSGKTTTIKYLLEQVANRDIPFLVLEPAKNEYQYIDFTEIKTYNLGSKNSGLQINPFYFPEGMHIQTHIDHIKSIFVAAFPMYGPMPYILETAIYNIYRKKGWDIVTSQTVKETDKYPTLEDLLYEIDAATEQAGYSNDLQNDIKGALKVRINSLITGAKGNILNCTETEGAAKILKDSTVISLESIGDPQEKVFLMGLILVSIYEYYIAKGEYSKKLQNLLVFEEAHRLLENVQSNNNPEIADMKGNAVETFNNILSEIRAYGQGIVIADQIPSKISSDVIKNTNLKIIHRLFAKDDRESIGHSIGLNNEQIDDLIHLETGTAVAFHCELDEAIKVSVPAQEKHMDIEKERTVAEDVLEYSVTDNPEFINEVLKWLRTSLLVGYSCDVFENITDLIAKDFGTSSVDKKTMWNKLVRIFLNDNKGLIEYEKSYTERFKLLDKIFDKPYEKLLELCKQYIQWKYRDEEEKTAPLFELFIPKEKYANSFLQNSRLIENGNFVFHTDTDYDEVIRISNTNRFLSLHRLEKEEWQKISDCIICNAYKDYPEIRDQYFGTLNKEYADMASSVESKELDELNIVSENLSHLALSQQKLCETLNNYVSAINDISEKRHISSRKDDWIKYLPFGIIAGLESIVAFLLIFFK